MVLSPAMDDEKRRRERERKRRRRERIRASWDPPGPVPPGGQGDPALEPSDDETLDHVCGHWRIFQRRDGHRFSTDDFVCAWYAAERARDAGLRVDDYLDLGTGIGSVALMVAWRLADARVRGIEVQPLSASLARRSARYNGIADRFVIDTGDLRDTALLPAAAAHDLITGSPPYLPLGTGLESGRPQRGPARFVHHGDVADYAAAASRALRPGGLFVLVYAAYRPGDVPAAARTSGLAIRTRRLVIPREGKEPLLELFCLGHGGEGAADEIVEPTLTVRDRAGRWTDEYQRVRDSMGFPSPPGAGK